MNWHSLTRDNIIRELKTSETGLTELEAKLRLKLNGLNEIAEKKATPITKIIFNQLSDTMVLILMGAALISGFLGDLTDAFVILFIIFINGVIGFFQEYNAEEALTSLRKVLPKTAKLIREGEQKTVPIREIAIGDLVEIESGDSVPADIRLWEVHSLSVDESSLTGESLPMEKFDQDGLRDDTDLAERVNMCYKGTYIVNGRALGFVVNTGMKTELGKISGLLKTKAPKTPLQIKMQNFGFRLSVVVIFLCLAFFGIGFLQGRDFKEMLFTSLSLAVAVMPESLPALITVALALGAKNMVKKKALVNKLSAVEALGSVSYICSDKTGTLTMNQMQVEDCLERRSGDNLLFDTMALCNDVVESQEKGILGEPTEVAIYQYSEKRGFTKSQSNDRFPRILEIPFDSLRKRMSTIHESVEDPNHLVVFTKGAMESILSVCTFEDAQEKKNLESEANEFAKKGKRVLGFAYKKIPKEKEVKAEQTLESDLTFLGFVGLLDPPRENVKQSIQECMEAGIRTIMITGDHPLTAKSIAERIGIIRNSEETVMTGKELENLSVEELSNRLNTTRVFARVTPEQKLNIIQAIQNKGQFVAMTGDGVNDAPALKKANIGIAMGITGSDVSKEASDIILLDDNFSTIVSAVKEGRKIYDNILKFIKYTFITNSSEMFTIVLAGLLGFPLPVYPVHILWINLVSDGLPGISLAFEKGEENLMKRPPKNPNESILNQNFLLGTLVMGLLIACITICSVHLFMETFPNEWRTMAFTILSYSQLSQLLTIRSDKPFYNSSFLQNPFLVVTIVLTFGLQILILYLPFTQRVLKVQPLTAKELLICISISLLLFCIFEMKKIFSHLVQSKRKVPRLG